MNKSFIRFVSIVPLALPKDVNITDISFHDEGTIHTMRFMLDEILWIGFQITAKLCIEADTEYLVKFITDTIEYELSKLK